MKSNNTQLQRKLNYFELRTPILDKCEGCERITDEKFCGAYLYPNMKWKFKDCNAATHIVHIEHASSAKKRVGQQKQRRHK